MALLSVEEALQHILDGVDPDRPQRSVRHRAAAAAARWPRPAARRCTQPPFDASAMDGYAVRAADVAQLPATLAVIGEAAAGHPFSGSVGNGQAVRIFTGAPVPAGADAIVIQENVGARRRQRHGARRHVERAATSAPRASTSAPAMRCSRPAAASARARCRSPPPWATAQSPVRRRLRVAVLATGDELRAAGQQARSRPDHRLQSPGGRRAGGGERRCRRACSASPATRARASMPTSPTPPTPTSSSPSAAPRSATTISSGRCWRTRGMALAFWKIAMRPGKPLMFGRLGQIARAGPAGQPGFGDRLLARVPGAADPRPARPARPGPRTCGQARYGRALWKPTARAAHYMRATSQPGRDGLPVVTPCARRTAPCWPRWRRPTACWSAPSAPLRRLPAAPCRSCPSTSEPPTARDGSEAIA